MGAKRIVRPCGGLHNPEQRVARWLVEVRDRIGSDGPRITHEFVSETLGARRAGIRWRRTA